MSQAFQSGYMRAKKTAYITKLEKPTIQKNTLLGTIRMKKRKSHTGMSGRINNRFAMKIR